MSLTDTGGWGSGAPGIMYPPNRRDQTGGSLAATWTFKQTLIGIGLTVLPLMALLIGSQLLASSTTTTKALTPAADKADAIVIGVSSAIIEALFLIAPIYYAIRTRPAGSSVGSGLSRLGFRGFNPGKALLIFVGGIIAILAFYQAYSFVLPYLHTYLHIPLQTNADTIQQEAKTAPYSTLALLLVAVTVAPLSEETFFRGYALPGFARAMPVAVAVVISSVLFGVAHADLGSLIPLIFIGLVLAVLRASTSSLWPGILFHALNNGLAFFVILPTILQGISH